MTYCDDLSSYEKVMCELLSGCVNVVTPKDKVLH